MDSMKHCRMLERERDNFLYDIDGAVISRLVGANPADTAELYADRRVERGRFATTG